MDPCNWYCPLLFPFVRFADENVGYWFLEDSENSTAKKWEPPSGLVTFMNKARSEGKKIVYIGFGSIVVSDPDAMTRCVIEAVKASGVYAIMSKGWSDRLVKNAPASTEPEEPLPKQIYPISSIPHDWLFKQIDAACHHGGAGTTGASLRGTLPHLVRMHELTPVQLASLRSSSPSPATSSSGLTGSRRWALGLLCVN